MIILNDYLIIIYLIITYQIICRPKIGRPLFGQGQNWLFGQLGAKFGQDSLKKIEDENVKVTVIERQKCLDCFLYELYTSLFFVKREYIIVIFRYIEIYK